MALRQCRLRALLGRTAHAAAGKVDPNEPQAKSLGYVEDATKVDAKANPNYKPGQICANCLQAPGEGRRGVRAVQHFRAVATSQRRAGARCTSSDRNALVNSTRADERTRRDRATGRAVFVCARSSDCLPLKLADPFAFTAARRIARVNRPQEVRSNACHQMGTFPRRGRCVRALLRRDDASLAAAPRAKASSRKNGRRWRT